MFPWMDWKEIPEFKREEYFKDLIAEVGSDEVYAGSGVDSATQSQLNLYFAMDRLCDRPERFMWLWRRNLLAAYPVYKDELDMWTERKAYKWYYDNQKNNVKTHDGTFELDENTKAELVRAIASKLEEVGKIILDTDSRGTSQSQSESESENENSSKGDSSNSGKERAFSFQYPESNYSGGVIPYDMDSNPSVEFISTQADKLNKGSEQHTDIGNGSESSSTSDDGTTTGHTNSTTDNTKNQDASSNQNDNETGEKKQNTKTHWEETTTYKGDSLTAIAKELLDELPATNFFETFVNKLKNCFQNAFIFDEIEEGL